MNDSEMCRRGHERTPENVRERILRRGGTESVIRECRPCARLTAAARKAALAQATDLADQHITTSEADDHA